MRMQEKAVSSLFWKLFERGGRAVVEFAVQIVMAHLLAPEEFGALAIMLVFVNVGNVIVQSGLNTALVQAQRVDRSDYSTVFWLSFGVSLVLYAAVFFCAPAIAGFYSMHHIEWPLRILAFILIINAFNAVQVAMVQRNLEFKKVFQATIASVVASGALGVTSAIAGAGLWALVIQQILYQLVNCAVLAMRVRWMPRFEFNFERAKALFAFGWKLLVSGLLDTGYQSVVDLIVGKQFSASNLGLVSQGKRYPAAIGGLLDGAIQPVMLSAVSRIQHDAVYVKRLVRRALKTSTFLIVPSMALFAVTAEPFVRLLLGEQWLPCVPFLQMYCFVYAFLPIHTTNLQALNGMGRSDLFLKLELLKKAYGLAILLVTAFVFQNVYLMVGSYILTGLVSTFVNAWPNRCVIGYTYAEQIRDICPAFCLAIVSAIAAYSASALGLPDAATIALQTAIMAAVYGGLSKIFKVEAFSYLMDTARGFILSKRPPR